MKGILFLFLFYSISCYSQITIHGTVKDAKTKLPLPYCAVGIQSSGAGCISNLEGAFRISVNSEKEILLFSYMGYKTRALAAAAITQNREILLEKKDIQLLEVQIHGNNDYLYDILEHCRKSTSQSQAHVAKIYFELETEIQEQPVEMLECYYNGHFKGATIDDLLLKNGRVGLAPINNRYFVSLSTSKAISHLNLTTKNNYFPFIPLQYKKSKLKKHYTLQLIYSDDKAYQIAFTPRKDIGSFFTGEIWIDRQSYSILKINMTGQNLSTHPFIPISPGDSLYNVSLDINQTYRKVNNQSLLNHINFNYQMNYKSSRAAPKTDAIQGTLLTRQISTSGVMYVYDYGSQFTLPYFEYDPDHGDYRKISFLPQNESFWKSIDGLILTEKQKRKLAFFEKDGMLLNFHETGQLWNSQSTFFETNNIFWSAKKRLSLKMSIPQNDSLARTLNQAYISDMYNIKVQIFLDVNEIGDSIQHYSATVLDVFDTFYHLPEEAATNCFINIFFDVCEIERREMEKTLNTRPHSLAQIDTIYRKTIETMNTKTNLYLKEVERGKNIRKLAKWNAYVLGSLNIDNITLFGLEEN